jgi:hypothetical protein
MNDILKLYLYDLLFHNIIPYDFIKTLSDISFNKLHKYYIVLYSILKAGDVDDIREFTILNSIDIKHYSIKFYLQGNYKSSAYDLPQYYNIRSFIRRVGEK